MSVDDLWLQAAEELRFGLPTTFRYRGFAPREPVGFSRWEEVLAHQLLGQAQRRMSQEKRAHIAQVGYLREGLALRVVRLALTEELALRVVVGADGKPVRPSSGQVIGRRGLRRLVDERAEARSPLDLECNRPLARVLTILAASLGRAAQRGCTLALSSQRPPLERRQRAQQEAGAIAAAIERGRLWE